MLMVCILGTRAMRVCVHTAWATVLLFGTKGNTRASGNGTARLQSRFLFMHINEAEHNPKVPLFSYVCEH